MTSIKTTIKKKISTEYGNFKIVSIFKHVGEITKYNITERAEIEEKQNRVNYFS